jgi:hypothetical protein
MFASFDICGAVKDFFGNFRAAILQNLENARE